jgi:hypothetical protein
MLLWCWHAGCRRLGLAEYEAMEAFVRYDPNASGTTNAPPGGTQGSTFRIYQQLLKPPMPAAAPEQRAVKSAELAGS